jgi:site-specific DNA recombinase
MKAAVYVRVSTDEQATEGYSLEAQKDILKDYCIAQDFEIYEIYEDDGYSGTNTKRPAYQKMLQDIDMWDVMLVLKIDRIHRNSRNFMNMMDYLEKRRKKFVSSTESLDTTNALGRFVVSMIQSIAQLESEQIGERTYIGMKEKADTMANTPKESRTLGFNPPFGYSLTNGVLMSVPEELDIVTRIFSEYQSGDTMDAIAYRLNREGVLTRKGNPWNVYNMRNILHNPIYAGFMRWDDVLVRHYAQTAVSPCVYNSVQQVMSSKVRDPAKRSTNLVPDDDFS